MLLTTVAMPVFSKKNETVRGHSLRSCSRDQNLGPPAGIFRPVLLDLAGRQIHLGKAVNADSRRYA